MKILTFADIHLSDKNPAQRIDNYRDTILNKLEQIRDLASELKVDLAICAGDMFHRKHAYKNSHYLVSKTIDIFKRFPCRVFSIYGNHDLWQDNKSTLVKQPFYTLLKSQAITFLEDSYFDEGNVRVFGMDYLSDPEYPDFNRERNGERVQICVAHVNASSQFDDLFGEKVYTYQELKNTSSDIFVFGHYHPDQGIEVHNDKYFINVGSISRGSLKKDELSRIPNVGYIEIDENYNIECSKIPLNVLVADEIFDLELKEKEEEENRVMEKFISEMKSKITVSDDEDISATIQSLNFEKRIKDKALDLLSDQEGE